MIKDASSAIQGKKIAIIGSGNVATHLAKAFENKADVTLVNPHTPEEIPHRCDIAIICVKDSMIQQVAQKLSGRASILAHTSGSIPMDALAGCAEMTGVFYPLQTFTKDVDLDYSEIPVFIEGDTPEAVETLSALAASVFGSVAEADSEARKRLHLASVFACNFTNALLGISSDILAGSGLDFSVMLPLIRQTIGKLSSLSPAEAQTGPAVREDWNVMQKHLQMLSPTPDIQSAYRILSSLIISRKKNHKLKQHECD